MVLNCFHAHLEHGNQAMLKRKKIMIIIAFSLRELDFQLPTSNMNYSAPHREKNCIEMFQQWIVLLVIKIKIQMKCILLLNLKSKDFSGLDSHNNAENVKNK